MSPVVVVVLLLFIVAYAICWILLWVDEPETDEVDK